MSFKSSALAMRHMYIRFLSLIIFQLSCVFFLIPITAKAITDDFTDTQELEDIQQWDEENKEELEGIQQAEDEKEIESFQQKEKEERQKEKKIEQATKAPTPQNLPKSEAEKQQILETKKKELEKSQRLDNKRKELEKKARKSEDKKDWTSAISDYEKLTSQFPENAHYLYRLGVLHAYLKNWNLSEKYLQKALEKNPANLDVRTALARMYYWKKDYAQAEEELKKVLEENPHYSGAHLLLGRIYLAQGKDPAAEKEFQQALEDRPQDTAVLLPYAQMHFHNRDYRQAKNFYDQTLAKPDVINKQTIRQRLIEIKPYVDPSLTYDVSYAQEREKDLVSLIKTIQLETFNNFIRLAFPVNNYTRPYVFFDYFSEKQKNLVVKLNNYSTKNYLYSVGVENFFKKYFTTKIEAKIRRTENSKLNIFDFHNTTRFEPLVAFKFAKPRYMIFITGFFDSQIGRDFTNNFSYLVRRKQALAVAEYRFNPPLCGIGAEGKLTYYSNPIFNRKDRGSLWARLGANFFTCDFMVQYQFDYQAFHKTIADYYTFKKEYSHWFRFLFFKKWLPNKELEITYEHLWRDTRDLTNDATAITFLGQIPDSLKQNRYDADIVNIRYKIVMRENFHFELAGLAYTNTNDYNVLMAKGHFIWVF